MTEPGLEQALRSMLAEISPRYQPSVGAETDLFRAGVLDSIEVLNFVSRIEEKYAVDIQADDIYIENFKNLSAVLSLLKEKYGV